MTAQKIAIFLPSMAGGGAERVMLTLAGQLANRGHPVDLVLAKAEGPYLEEVPDNVHVVDLGASRVLTSLPSLVHYLRRERPDAMVSALDYANIVAMWANRLARTRTRTVIVEQNTLSEAAKDESSRRGRMMPKLAARFYRWADVVAGVSSGVVADLKEIANLPDAQVRVIYNPAVNPEILTKAAEPVDHPWFEDGDPVFLAVGRLDPQKDYPMLLTAIARTNAESLARLVILGNGPERASLEAMRDELGLGEVVELPGFTPNPFAFMARATALVMSSRYEGLPTVLIEGLMCGAPIISTDCPSGPSEILDGGRYGRLVPVGDPDAMAEAMLSAMAGEIPRPGADSWERFQLDRVVDQYVEALTGERVS